MQPNVNRQAWFACAGFAAMLICAWYAYFPGLAGSFVFDDFANLPVLGYYGRIDNWTSFWLYITSGSADPTGRPLALLSFLLDANDWPADPYAFKRTSVLMHLLNGVLLTWLLLKLGNTARVARAETSAVLGAALWLLHPFFVSTTLYVVQRETILAATFVLLGLIGWVSGRRSAAQGSRAGAWLAGASVWACTILAVLTKANGALLPLLALCVDTLLLAQAEPVVHPRTQELFARVRRVTLGVPSILLAAFLAYKAWSGFVDGVPAIRPWTLGERLLTESRMLMSYLGELWLPHAFSPGLFNDGATISTGLLSPPSTLLSILAIACLLAGAWHWRKQHRQLALAILFFFAGHLLESSVIPLELYFEHRNYVPAMLLFWPLASWLCGTPAGTAARSYAQTARYALGVLLPVVLGLLTLLAANLWGDAHDQMLVWAARNPQSPRAQVTAAQVERSRGDNRAAIARLEKALRGHPSETQIVLNLLGAKCSAGGITEHDIERAAYALHTTRAPGRVGGDWFAESLGVAQDGSCPGLTIDVLQRLLQASADNPDSRNAPGNVRQGRLNLEGRIALIRGEDERALALFNAAVDADPRPDAALLQTAIMASAGKPILAKRHLERFRAQWRGAPGPVLTMPALHAWLLDRTGYWEREIAHMRETLDADIAASAHGASATPDGVGRNL